MIGSEGLVVDITSCVRDQFSSQEEAPGIICFIFSHNQDITEVAASF